MAWFWFLVENFSFEVSSSDPGNGDGAGVQFPWEDRPTKNHQREMEMSPFYMDRFPVTIDKYNKYLYATGYYPEDDYNWLKNWNGIDPTDELLDLPVTYVSMDEARAYCAWVGARLPHSYEWQYAAQGTTGQNYPWGSAIDATRYPIPQRQNVHNGPEPVTTYAGVGDSPFGISDLVGNVWQYTDEFQDERQRFVVLRGGSNYKPAGSNWYFPGALELNKQQKYFLMDHRFERADTVGFRCVMDADVVDIEVF